MSLKTAYENGAQAALSRFKVSNLTAGAAAYNPTLNAGQTSATAMPGILPKSATPPTAPLAAGASKSSILG